MATEPRKFSAGAALDWLESRFGGPLREEEIDAAPGTTSIQAAPRDFERVSLTFVNLGTTTLFVRPGGLATTASGFRLGSSGGLISLSILEDGLLPCLEWSVVGDAAGGDLYTLICRRESRTRNPQP